ncbi:MAG TPA: LysR substrate-binding domain-containing protein [Xanthobacteraceae bacterium]|nr:LysR substrate-binding domain-containing protein [Xanthobacteraceae bacterium]
MDLSDLHIFRSVVEAGGVTRAAEKLNRVQSNVTTRVRQLESELGVDLFVREGKRLHVSPAGKLLLDYAERLIDLAREAREAVHDAKPRGLLRLGAGESTAAMRLPAPMKDYLGRYSQVTLELRTGNARELAAALLSGELDAAFVTEPIADTPFEKLAIYEEELVIIAAAGHPPIKSPRDASPQTVLAFEPGCAYRKRLEDWFAHHGEMPERIVEIASYHAMLGCAVAGMGISLMPRNVLSTFPDAKFLSTHALPPALALAQTSLIWRKGTLSPKLRALIEVLTAHSDTPKSRRGGRNKIAHAGGNGRARS